MAATAVVTGFRLRPMEAGDGPAMARLLREEAQTTRISLTTTYRHDVVTSLLAQHPTLFGVVAEVPGDDRLAGMATAFMQDLTIGGRPYRTAFLENLKVRSDLRRQGLGGRLAAWRIEEAERRTDGDLVVMTVMDSTNEGSLATARRWATQILGPITVRITRMGGAARSDIGIRVRPLQDADVAAVVDGARTFYVGYDLAPVITPDLLDELLASTALGEPIREYRVAVADDGSILGGAGVGERYKVMVDHIDRIPAPLALLGRLTGVLPADRILRSVELFLVWHRPGRADAARVLWDAIRAEWRDRATGVGALVDPRGTLHDAMPVGRMPGPDIRLTVAVRSPMPIAEDRLIYLWR
jgi:predicted N-acetyltransferase YhbS